jgi:hypothetical protein
MDRRLTPGYDESHIPMRLGLMTIAGSPKKMTVVALQFKTLESGYSDHGNR